MQNKNNFKRMFILTILLVWGLFLTVACTPSSISAPAETDENTEMEGEMDHEEGGEHDDNNLDTIPNNGAVIRITSPADGATFKAG